MSIDESSFDSSSKKRTNRPDHNIGQACNFCKKRHIKCDGTFPCSQCIKRGIQCSFGAKSKRGPKPKADLYDHCNKLMVDLEVQKQIAEYWKDQFMNTLSKHGNEVCLDSGISFDLDNDDDYVTSTELEKSNDNHSFNSRDNDPIDLTLESVLSEESIHMDFNESIPNTYIESYQQEYVMNESRMIYALNEFSQLLSSYAPEYEFIPSPAIAMEVWNSTKADREAIEDYEKLVSMLEHSIGASFGFQILSDPESMRRFSKKTEDILHILFFQKEVQCIAEFAPKLIILLSLLSIFYSSDDKEGSKQSVIMLAYQIISMHRTKISPKMMHRVYFIMMILSETQVDRLHWFNQANALVSQANILSPMTVCAPIVFVFNSLHPKGDIDCISPFLTHEELNQFILNIDAMQSDDITIKELYPDNEKYIEFINFRDLMTSGILSEIYYHLGNFEEAQLQAIKSIASLKRVKKVGFSWIMIGLQSALETAASLNMVELVEEGMIFYDKYKLTYTIVNRFKNRLTAILNRHHYGSNINKQLTSQLPMLESPKQYNTLHYNNNFMEHSIQQVAPIGMFPTMDDPDTENYTLHQHHHHHPIHTQDTTKTDLNIFSHQDVNNIMFNVDRTMTDETGNQSFESQSLSMSGNNIMSINLDDLLMLSEEDNHPLFN